MVVCCTWVWFGLGGGVKICFNFLYLGIGGYMPFASAQEGPSDHFRTFKYTPVLPEVRLHCSLLLHRGTQLHREWCGWFICIESFMKVAYVFLSLLPTCHNL